MRILVVDDNEINQAAARAQLSDYDLTVVGSYDEAEKLINREMASVPGEKKFDVVLADLLMPASGLGMCSNILSGQEMPIGIFLALLAAKNGAKQVAVFTDCNHHAHPVSACFDAFNPDGEYEPSPLSVGTSSLFLVNNRNWVEDFCQSDLSKPIDCQEMDSITKAGEGNTVITAKNGKELLSYIIK